MKDQSFGIMSGYNLRYMDEPLSSAQTFRKQATRDAVNEIRQCYALQRVSLVGPIGRPAREAVCWRASVPDQRWRLDLSNQGCRAGLLSPGCWFAQGSLNIIQCRGADSRGSRFGHDHWRSCQS